MTDVRQSLQYAQFMHDLGWMVVRVGKWNAFVRQFPIIGSFIKIQKVKPPLPFPEIEKLEKKYRIIKLQISPDIPASDKKIYKQFTKYQYRVDNAPNIPTQTIQIDLTKSEEKLFNNLAPAKRRAVRKAVKNGIKVKPSHDIDAFIEIRKKQNFPLGFLLVKEMKSLWKNFFPKNAALLLAFSRDQNSQTIQKRVAAGILLLFYDSIAYYWYASSNQKGKRMFAPSLLVWEAIKLSKRKKCKVFDFEGIFDERFPAATGSWRGFTKFKEGFGGIKVSFIGSYIKSSV